MINSHETILLPISTLLWNANGLMQQKNELKAFLAVNNIDILLISESHLTTHSNFHIPGLLTYHCDHPDGTVHAGSSLIIKTNISHAVLPQFQTTSLQATNITISLNYVPTTISSVYCPPGHANKISDNDFTQYFKSLGNKFLSGGDFNSKHHIWRSRVTNTRGLSLYRSLLSNNSDPTYWPSHFNRVPDILDFFIHTLPNHINYNTTNLADFSEKRLETILPRSYHSPPMTTIFLNNVTIPTTQETRYLGVHLDSKLTLAYHIKTKRKSLNLKLNKMKHLLKSNLPLNSLNTKLVIYKQILHPSMTYGIQLWGTSKQSNIQKFQSFQSICLCHLTNAPWYVSNLTLHSDLKIPNIYTLASHCYKLFHKNTVNHPNPLISDLSSLTLPDNPTTSSKTKLAQGPPRPIIIKIYQ
ncbi:Uncharacterized protein FWK35_00027208 [Aphis craccivora]|uniref:Endonuclease/exonuclease/phosphatase domain-containing protein n=1 Tax=Aphis craccivora TaxID=307492 RepID=A0A6G0W0F6_APHCR|nr:Uncharacterized protein FWK35_00027208 [Aphis craccivora]